MDIVRERLEREYDLELMATMPSVEFEITLTDGSVIPVHNPTDMPDPARIAEVREPYIRASILTPKEYIGQIMELCQERRGNHAGMHYLSSERVQLTYDLPLAEIVLDFFDQLKTRTKGYASLDYEPIGLRPSNLVKLDVLLGGDPVDALSMVVHRDKAYEQGKQMTERLRKRIPRQQYDVPIQAAVGAKIIARETVKAFRKDVTAKCYGGDISPQAQAAREAEGRQEADEAGRPHRGPAGGVPGRAGAGGRQMSHATRIWSVARRSASTRRAVGEQSPLCHDVEAAREAGFDDVVAPPMFAAVYSWRGDGAGRARPGDRHRLLAPGPRRAGVHLARAGRRRRRDHHRGRVRRRGRARRHSVFTFSSRSINQRGELVCEGTWTNIVR